MAGTWASVDADSTGTMLSSVRAALPATTTGGGPVPFDINPGFPIRSGQECENPNLESR